MKKITLVLGLAIIASMIAYVIYAVYEDQKPKSIAFESLDKEFAHLDAVYEKWFTEPIDVLAIEGGSRVVCHWHQYLALSSKQSEGHADALEQFNNEAMDFVVSHGIRALYWASLQASNDLIAMRSKDAKEAREKLLQRCQEECPKLSEKIDDNLEAFDIVARAEGFFDDNANIRPEKTPLVRLLHRQIWNKALTEQFLLENIQAPEETRLLWLWAIEGSQRSVEKKLSLINGYKANIDKDYDDNYAKAILYLQIQDRAAACMALKTALDKPECSEAQRQKYINGLKVIHALEPSACDVTALTKDY